LTLLVGRQEGQSGEVLAWLSVCNSSLVHNLSTPQISQKSSHTFVSYPAKEQTSTSQNHSRQKVAEVK